LYLKIMTANIRFENPNDGRFNWPHRKNVLKKSIDLFSPDILGTQEGRMPQLHDLRTLITNFDLADIHREWIAERMYPCLFYNPQRLLLRESGDIWLSQTPDIAGSLSFDSAFPRLCTWATFDIMKAPARDKTIMIINTHLDHILPATRLSQIQVLIEEIKKINALQLPIILMGDFNEAPEGPVYKTILNQLPEIRDPWKELKLKEEGSHHNFDGNNTDNSRIDWILASKQLTPKELYLDKYHESTFPSDHFPLKGVFKL